ncbi:Single-stranded DNA-binding protein [subsurface metagenome]
MLTFLNVSGLVYTANEPELKYTPNQTAVVNLTVVVNRQWTGSDNARHEESCFIGCVCFNKLAEIVSENVGKGEPLYIEGRLKQECWEKDGVNHSKHVLMLNRVIYFKPKE